MRILAAGDAFVSTDLLKKAVRAELAVSPDFRELSLAWPVEPFGPVGGVHEASGTEEQVIAALDGAEVAITQMAPFTKKVFAAAPGLRMVSVCRGGPVNVDLVAATEAGVAVTFAPGRNAAAAAEFAIGMLLAAMRRIATSSAELLAGTWRGDYYSYDKAGIEVEGTTIGLVGYGAIGSRVARVLAAFGAHVLVSDPYADQDRVRADGAEPAELDDLLRRSAAVSLHARLTDETRNLIDERRLGLLPHGAVLVNTARGGLLDYAPLAEALRAGKLGALALDVYDVEPPPPDWPLRDAPNVIATPHLGGASRQTADRAARIVAEEVGRLARGEKLVNVANPDVLGR
ncbi:hydroxyacid dehydrogenase [Prauserella marina]|uniref:D-3-phosphoglycerate dehydrogenase n=1 Tax=Prauserella marina TaxID=530584 RepID=A0A222VWQ1_9PSEU|nr:2-hydroxyacid dehydrogenase [Prauserella marina]ASR38335.1 hydroxyacid dehydrogenase [Prauserella marina]PWV78451.1 D-3-phosphoglycerate dehydrogenase [Prauserella marina]SDC86285.1 D-3-phosphoglycerate dehydrogenase [Prauserella marina]